MSRHGRLAQSFFFIRDFARGFLTALSCLPFAFNPLRTGYLSPAAWPEPAAGESFVRRWGERVTTRSRGHFRSTSLMCLLSCRYDPGYGRYSGWKAHSDLATSSQQASIESTEAAREVDAITWVGALVNVGLAAFKVSWLLDSVAELFDLVNCSSVCILYDPNFFFHVLVLVVNSWLVT